MLAETRTENLPRSHARQLMVDDVLAKVPLSHVRQSDWPAADEYSPTVQPTHVEAPCSVLIEPAGQGAHSVRPSVAAKRPAAHLSDV